MFKLAFFIFNLLVDLLILFSLPSLVFFFWFYHAVVKDMPTITNLGSDVLPVLTSVYSRDGLIMGEFFREKRYYTKFKDIPPLVVKAFIAAEDLNFFLHKGIDYVGIIRALVVNLKEGRIKQGGSTITQQVVKNLLLTREKSLVRKIQEALLAYQIERHLSKEQILELYLNLVFLGNNSYGVAAAAKNYFRKSLSDLNLAEITLLAGLPQAPTKYSPIRNYKSAKARQRYVLDQMVKGGFISQQEADEAYRAKLEIFKADLSNFFFAPYYLAEVRKELEELFPELDIDAEGLTVETFLISDFQRAVERAVNNHLLALDKKYGFRGSIPDDSRGSHWPLAKITKIDYRNQSIELHMGNNRYLIKFSDQLSDYWKDDTIISKIKVNEYVEFDPSELKIKQTPEIQATGILLNPKGGEVLALHGGFSFKVSQFNRATQSFRQAGSAFKPIVYLTAVDKFSYHPMTLISDSPRTFRVGGQIWSPSNYDGEFKGRMTLTKALEQSRNLPAVILTASIGPSSIIQTARSLGIDSKLPRNLTLALGSGDVTPLELTRAYGVICSEGVLAKTRYVKTVKNSKGDIIYDSDKNLIDNVKQVVDPRASFILTQMMKYVILRGTATILRDFPVEVSGKTGTTNEFMDAWFVGCTPDFVAGVWVGFDVKKTLGDKMTGGKVAAPIWKDFMVSVYEKIQKTDGLGVFNISSTFLPPEGVVKVFFNPITGEILNEQVPGAYEGYVRVEDLESIKKSQPSSNDSNEVPQISDLKYLESPDL